MMMIQMKPMQTVKVNTSQECRECMMKQQIEVEHISGEEQKADILTKTLPTIEDARTTRRQRTLKYMIEIKGEIVGVISICISLSLVS
jgi:hypothetical protein